MVMTKTYHTVNGRILGETAAGVRTDYLTDALGSVTATVNAAGAVVNRYRYKPYGALLSKTGVGADPKQQWVGSLGYRQTGKKYSDVYVRARHYDTANGRWTSKDPLLDVLQNAYTYAENQPVVLFDPTGLLACDDIDPNINLPFACLVPANCKDECDKAGSGYKLNLPRPLLQIPGKDCPRPGSVAFEQIREGCKFDRYINPNKYKGYYATSTCCCKRCTSGNNCRVEACTKYYNDPWNQNAKLYQACIWDHQMERRQCCYDTCSYELMDDAPNKRWHAQVQRCVWKYLVQCYGASASSLLSECRPNLPPPSGRTCQETKPTESAVGCAPFRY